MEFKELIKERRSVRSYAETNISLEDINEIFEDVRLAPSWKNYQESRYYIANSKEKIAEVFEALPSFNQNSSKNATLVVTTFKKGLAGFNQEGEALDELGDGWGAYDAGFSNAYFILAAKNKGYDTLIMGLRDVDKLREIFAIPEDEMIVAVIALGKGNKEAKLNPRKELNEILKVE